nr:aspartate kinase [Tissierella simiarum]
MKIIVQKFGGSSVATKESRKMAIEKIIEKYNEGYGIVVVVSAIGRKGDPYATDTFLDLINQEILDKRDIDLLISCGEIVSSVLLSNEIKERGYNTCVFTGIQAGILTDNNFGEASILEINPTSLIESLERGNINIVAGFQGGTNDMEITTLGRGGSDISAVALGRAINCEKVEIFTDVDGVMTGDPNMIPKARLLKTMSFYEVYQLAKEGAKIIHPKAIEIALENNIPIVIKNTFTNSDGTILKAFNSSSCKKKEESLRKRLVSSLTYQQNRVQVKILNNNINKVKETLEEIVKEKISLDFFDLSKNTFVFNVNINNSKRLKKILDNNSLDYEIIPDCSKISIVGKNLCDNPEALLRILDVFYHNKIEIFQISASHDSIWCLINQKDLESSLNLIHDEFKLYEES